MRKILAVCSAFAVIADGPPSGGQPVTFTAAVSSAASTPTGTLTFASDGNAPIPLNSPQVRQH
jgi:hypothetical protein